MFSQVICQVFLLFYQLNRLGGLNGPALSRFWIYFTCRSISSCGFFEDEAMGPESLSRRYDEGNDVQISAKGWKCNVEVVLR